ncbi:MAG: hypothetical protein KVP17_001750 [Porospora cf. gigantea B]|uniref:uncharacterized protein n=1 Tax=Porospora cf. gigantea B TaxID=2853592 RepID=UPI00357198C0|nr:MAG: hypothetical protein KVP17_001750 [Porospora cf. gigantea B]
MVRRGVPRPQTPAGPSPEPLRFPRWHKVKPAVEPSVFVHDSSFLRNQKKQGRIMILAMSRWLDLSSRRFIRENRKRLGLGQGVRMMFVAQDPGELAELRDFRQSFLDEAELHGDMLVLPFDMTPTDYALFVDYWVDSKFRDLDFIVKHNCSRSLVNWPRVLEFLSTKDAQWSSRPVLYGWITVRSHGTRPPKRRGKPFFVEPNIFVLSRVAVQLILEKAESSSLGELDIAVSSRIDIKHAPNLPPTAESRQHLKRTFHCEDLWVWWAPDVWDARWEVGMKELQDEC